MKRKFFQIALSVFLSISLMFSVNGVSKSAGAEPEVKWLNGTYSFVRYAGEGLISFSKGRIKSTMLEYIDENGNLVSPNFGYMDENGKEVIPCKYKSTGNFIDGLAQVRDSNFDYGYIDRSGNEVIPCAYDSMLDFSEGMVAVQKGDKWGYIDKNGNEIIPYMSDYPENSKTMDFSEGMVVIYKEQKYGFMDKNGNEVTPCIYRRARAFSGGLAMVQNDDYKYGFIDKNGNEVIPLIYDSISYYFSEGVVAVEKGGKWGYIDRNGNEVIPLIYDSASGFSEGLASVQKGDKRGYIDKNGREVIPFIYWFASGFSEGLADVYIKEDDRSFRIDKNGNEIFPYIEAEKDGKYCLIDENDIASPYIYDDIIYINNNVAWVEMDHKWGIVNLPSADGSIKVILKGQYLEFDQKPVIRDGYTFVPLRAIFEEMDAKIDWDETTQTVTSTRNGITITMQIGNNFMIKNGEQIELDATPALINGKTLVPVRAVAESFGCNVDWNSSMRTVIITETAK